jgi:hypothetical protein
MPPASNDDELRQRISALLSGEAINPPWTARALSQRTFDAVVRALQDLRPDDLVGKLVVGGFTLHAYMLKDDPDQIVHACSTCIYYERHRRFCNLPELMLPVEPQWSCIVWRI